MAKQTLTEQEWSHFFDVDDIEAQGTTLTIEASEEERHDMARRLNVPAINLAKADLTLKNVRGGQTIHVTGQFQAKVTLKCVVTLEEFEEEFSEPVEGWFADKDKTVSFVAAKRERDVVKQQGEVEVIDEKEDPEPILNGVVDLGELVTQHISLSIPPYPRKEGAAYEIGDDQVQVDEKSPLRKNPFEKLKDWKENR
jgi:uncharacterized metal-binding protein YceD (DUF177 family)